jgi:hypothetical protein
MIQWFFDSLHAQCKGDYSYMRIIVVDFYAQVHLEWTEKHVSIRKGQFPSRSSKADTVAGAASTFQERLLFRRE